MRRLKTSYSGVFFRILVAIGVSLVGLGVRPPKANARVPARPSNSFSQNADISSTAYAMDAALSPFSFMAELGGVRPGFRPGGLALVFGGAGTENDIYDGALAGAVNAAQAAGFTTVTVTHLVSDDQLTRARVWIQPGGPNFDQAADMQVSGVFAQVRDFVAAGGGYVGFCGGGYMAQSSGGYGLGLLRGTAVHQGGETMKIPVTWNGKTRYLHFEHGPRFQRTAGVEVFATYDSNGAPAAIRGLYGKGKVYLSGPHPEALSTWEPFEDPDGLDTPLAVEMIQAAASNN